jgi:hypothetical protein
LIEHLVHKHDCYMVDLWTLSEVLIEIPKERFSDF